MRWEETVKDMGNPQILPGIYVAQQKLLREQAEVSYKAGEVAGYQDGFDIGWAEGIVIGRDQGRREVVKWVELYATAWRNLGGNTATMEFPTHLWQAMKKERGID